MRAKLYKRKTEPFLQVTSCQPHFINQDFVVIFLNVGTQIRKKENLYLGRQKRVSY